MELISTSIKDTVTSSLSELALVGSCRWNGLNTPDGYDVLVAKYIVLNLQYCHFITQKFKFEALAAS